MAQNKLKRLEARYRRFDTLGIHQAAYQDVSAGKCISFNKTGTGNDNKEIQFDPIKELQRI